MRILVSAFLIFIPIGAIFAGGPLPPPVPPASGYYAPEVCPSCVPQYPPSCAPQYTESCAPQYAPCPSCQPAPQPENFQPSPQPQPQEMVMPQNVILPRQVMVQQTEFVPRVIMVPTQRMVPQTVYERQTMFHKFPAGTIPQNMFVNTPPSNFVPTPAAAPRPSAFPSDDCCDRLEKKLADLEAKLNRLETRVKVNEDKLKDLGK